MAANLLEILNVRGLLPPFKRNSAAPRDIPPFPQNLEGASQFWFGRSHKIDLFRRNGCLSFYELFVS